MDDEPPRLYTTDMKHRRSAADRPDTGHLATLHALVETILPHLDVPERQQLVRRTAERIERAPAAIRADLLRALAVLDSRPGALLVTGRLQRFSRQARPRRHGSFDRWSRSAIPAARAVHQALRRLVMSTWYVMEDSRRDAGVEAPLHSRAPRFAWEGPLGGEPTRDEEPVARRPDPSGTVPGAWPDQRSVPPAVVARAQVNGDRRLTADVVVIGSGAGGAVAACRFAEAGREVVILEEGPYLHAPDFTEDEGALMARLFADQAMRTTVDGAVSLLQGGAVGGGSTVNWMLMLRPPGHVLDEWSRHDPGMADLVAGLAPHLDRVEAEVHARLVPDDAHSPSNRALLTGARALGWRARAAMINARGCVRAGTCTLGCRYDAKQSVLLSYLPRALEAGATLHEGATVVRLEVAERGGGGPTPPMKRVHAVVRDERSGNARGRLVVDAPIVVLAAGAVGTPAILQRSGLGGGGVGRYLRLHPTTAVMAQYDAETYPLAGIPQSALCDEFLQRDANGYGFWIECPGLLPGLAAASLPGFGTAHLETVRRLRHLVAFIVLVRDGSGSDRSMGSVWVDRRGHTRVRYRLTRHDAENVRAGLESAARLHLAAGARSAMTLHTPPVLVHRADELGAVRAASVAPNRLGLFSAHVNGTCRLGADPATSGCGPTGERHGVPGLYVMDGSLLPTAPGVNPQETIMALASLLAERAIR